LNLRGAVAQLGERLNGIQKADGSIPFSSTIEFFQINETGLQFRVPLAQGMLEDTDQRPLVDPFYWEKLSQLHPTDVCNRTDALYNPARGGFLLAVYNLRYLVLPKTRKILRMEWNDQPVEEELCQFFYLMVLVYLTKAKDIEPTHTWVSEKDLKGGSTFFRGPHGLDVGELENVYGGDSDAFLEAGRRLGGSEILLGDKGFALEVFPKVPLAYILWIGDKEFPAKIGVLFDSTIESHLPLDIIWCTVAETNRRLVRKPPA
jgi:hypothetical protein